jgi:hypothetical protein
MATTRPTADVCNEAWGRPRRCSVETGSVAVTTKSEKSFTIRNDADERASNLIAHFKKQAQ